MSNNHSLLVTPKGTDESTFKIYSMLKLSAEYLVKMKLYLKSDLSAIRLSSKSAIKSVLEQFTKNYKKGWSFNAVDKVYGRGMNIKKKNKDNKWLNIEVVDKGREKQIASSKHELGWSSPFLRQ